MKDDERLEDIIHELEQELDLERDRVIPIKYKPWPVEKRHKRKIAGVISWLGNKYDWDKDTVMWVRVGAVVGTLMGFGFPIIAYFVLMFFADD